jgi:hypothetical protein
MKLGVWVRGAAVGALAMSVSAAAVPAETL